MNYRILDLFCGIGGCSVGYSRAGFEPVGVDLVMMHDYPDEFHVGNALTWPLDGFDAVHASPPCKRYTRLAAFHRSSPQQPLFDPHPEMLTDIRRRLVKSGLPYVIEGVPGTPLNNPQIYCGSSFGLGVRRHRAFETNWPLLSPPCDHASQSEVIGVYGHGGGRDKSRGHKAYGAAAAAALGITHTNRQKGLSQAIPPAYTQHIGAQLLTHLRAS